MGMERLPEIFTRLDRLERDMYDLQKVWKSSVDDIKSIIKAEISDLKKEQIGDLKDAIKTRDRQLAEFENRIRDAETGLRSWETGRGLINWLVKTLIASGALVAGYLGGKHLS